MFVESFFTAECFSAILTSGSAFKPLYCTSRCLHQSETPTCSPVEIFLHQPAEALPPLFLFFISPWHINDLAAIKLTKGFLLHLSARDTFRLQLGKAIWRGELLLPEDELLMKHWTLRTVVLWKQWPTNMTCWLMLAPGGHVLSSSASFITPGSHQNTVCIKLSPHVGQQD